MRPRRGPSSAGSAGSARAEPRPTATSRRRDLEAFLAASRAAAHPGNLESALGVILDAALGLVDADEGSILLFDEQAGGLRILASRGLPASVRNATVVTPGRGIAGTVFSTGRPLLLPSPLDVSRFEGFVEKTRPIHSAVSVPLRSANRTIGVLNLNLVRPTEQLDEEDLQVAALFAEHAAIAIAGAGELDRTARAAADLQTLRAASTRLAASLQLDSVADIALDEAVALLGSSTGMLVLTGDGRVELARYRRLDRDSVRDVLRSPTFSAWLGIADPAIVRRAAADATFRALAPAIGPAPLVVAPLRGSDGSTRGLLAVVARPGADQSDARLLGAFATEAGLAIANAALHEQIRGKEEELSAIVEAITNPILLVDAAGSFRAINPAAAEAFRLSPEFERGQPAAGKLGPVIEELLFGRAEGQRDIALPVGGDPHIWRATVSTTRNGPVPGGRLLVLDDVTLQRELEQRKADFLAVIGHELRTPLTIIRGFASTLARNDLVLDDQTRASSVASILEQSGRLGQMIEDLLYVSRIENKTPPLHLVWGDVAETAASVLGGFRERDTARPFAMRTATTGAHLMFDPVKVEHVMRHLLDNAVKYSEPESPVIVTVSDEPDAVRITIEDKGVGIFSGDIPRLFRVFGQLDASATRRHGGTGIGLSVCKTLVDAMGGRIWATSMLGKGSEFSFTIPKSPPSQDRGYAP